ncbi:hypothetical protein ACFQX6_54155 [Streptosporangium lutulentum]
MGWSTPSTPAAAAIPMIAVSTLMVVATTTSAMDTPRDLARWSES